MTQYMRWKQVKQTGKMTREYLSMVDGEAPYMTFKFLPWLTSARSSVSPTAVTCTTVLLPDLLFLHCNFKDQNSKFQTIEFQIFSRFFFFCLQFPNFLTCDLATVEEAVSPSRPPDPALLLACMAARLCSANFCKFW